MSLDVDASPLHPVVIHRLCYIDGPWAYFTTQPVAEQWGDDWDDAPYEHNAGDPYEPCWHNEPKHRYDPSAKRGLKPGTQTPLAVGELCRCASCRRDWNEDGTPAYAVEKVAWEGPFQTPADACHGFSVKDINSGAIAWLRSTGVNPPVNVNAGDTLQEFKAKVRQAGGKYYTIG